MENEPKAEDKKNSLMDRILVPVIIAILAGGSSPWWFNALLGKPAAKTDTPTAVVNPQPVATTSAQQLPPPAPAAPVASRQFFLGRWRYEATMYGTHVVNTMDYFESGRFDGHMMMANNFGGRDTPESGVWDLEKLSDQSFRLTLRGDTGAVVSGTFKIIDQDHIQNTDENYIAERVK